MQSRPAAERREDLVALYREAAACERCPLHATRTNVVFGAGNADADLMFVGEAPGQQEDLQGLPFVGRAGKLLDQLLEEVGLARDQVFIANVLKSRPPGNRDPQPEEIAACRPYLDRQIELIEPTRDLHARELRHEAAHPLSARDHAGPRAPAGARGRRAHGADLPALPPGRRAADAARAGGAQGGLRAACPELLGRAAAGAARARWGRWPRRPRRGPSWTCSDSAAVVVESAGPGETEAAGAALARRLAPGDVVLVSGELGAGRRPSCAAPAARSG